MLSIIFCNQEVEPKLELVPHWVDLYCYWEILFWARESEFTFTFLLFKKPKISSHTCRPINLFRRKACNILRMIESWTYWPWYIDEPQTSTRWRRSNLIPAGVYTHILDGYIERVGVAFLEDTKVYVVGHQLYAPHLRVSNWASLYLPSYLLFNKSVL